MGGIAADSPLQQMDYKYNIRGWMTRINDPSNLNGKLFGYEVRYNNPVNTQSVGKFNGNIAEIDWNNGSENLLKRYNYEYDALNRLTNAFYKEPSTGNTGYFDEYLSYDLNGNILTLKRNASPVSQGTTFVQVDDLSYQYTGNRLDKIIESALNDTGYEGGDNIIDYDLNGNMITMLDKGIHGITYNYLNLPDNFSIIQTNSVGEINNFGLNYLYKADGTKVRKTYTSGGGRGTTTITTNITDYLDDLQYGYSETTICLWCRTSVAYEQAAFKNENDVNGIKPINPTWILDFVSTTEGFYSFAENRYIYQYKDHLGNTRVSFGKDSTGALKVTDTNNYYAFGMNHIGANKGLLGGYKNYKYQGQELQETGFYSFKWRNYMPDVGRFFNIDPLSEKYAYQSHYNFSENRVVDGRELEGLEWTASRNLESKTVNLHLTYKPVNNTAGVLSNAQMSTLLQEREAQIISSFGGKDSGGNQVNITFSQSDNSTMVWDYSVGYDTKNVDDFKNGANTDAKYSTNGMTDTNNNTQTNRTQINVITTDGLGWDEKKDQLNFDNKNRSDVAKTGAHETGHTLGIGHNDKATLRSTPDNLMRAGGPGTKITPEQRTNAIKLVEEQQPKN
ncbi:RHS repeat-associated core domain-containing protein [Chryseobacterium sp. GVT01B]|uniref:RHS repeat-associated core domain-containing protein n=1 Tax=Chryseobacterium sp. GVT01B TaxID=2862675 RepID=UPI001CBA7C78|nr:RHS repeat-associated core domain-containing protein [Chryseobacterium sp. GVT01B]